MTYAEGDRVRDTRYGGTYTGTINRIDEDGDIFVTWDGHFADYQESPDTITPLTGAH